MSDYEDEENGSAPSMHGTKRNLRKENEGSSESDSFEKIPDDVTAMHPLKHDDLYFEGGGDQFSAPTKHDETLVSTSDELDAHEKSLSKKDFDTTGGDCVTDFRATLENLLQNHPASKDLLLWERPQKSASILTALLLLQLVLMLYSFIYVLANLGLLILALSTLGRLYLNFFSESTFPTVHRSINAIFQHNFCTLTASQLKIYVDSYLEAIDTALNSVKRKLLCENFTDSVKLAIYLYLVSYVGAFFNLASLLLIGTLVVFSLPKIYISHQKAIDEAARLASLKFSEVLRNLKGVPGLGALVSNLPAESGDAAKKLD